MTDLMRAFYLIGRLEAEIEIVKEQIAELKGAAHARTIDHEPAPEPERHGNIICLPRVTLATARRSRRRPRRPEGGQP